MASRGLTWRRERLVSEGFAQMGQGVRERAEARAEAEDVDGASCGAPVWLRWRAKQDLRGGEPLDDAHGSAADRTVPE